MSAAVPLVVITRPAEAGPSLARALERHGLRTWHVTPTVVTARGGSAELLRAMATTPPGLAGRRLLWPRSDVACDTWTAVAADAGARVTAPVAYCTVAVQVEALEPLATATSAGVSTPTWWHRRRSSRPWRPTWRGISRRAVEDLR